MTILGISILPSQKNGPLFGPGFGCFRARHLHLKWSYIMQPVQHGLRAVSLLTKHSSNYKCYKCLLFHSPDQKKKLKKSAKHLYRTRHLVCLHNHCAYMKTLPIMVHRLRSLLEKFEIKIKIIFTSNKIGLFISSFTSRSTLVPQ